MRADRANIIAAVIGAVAVLIAALITGLLSAGGSAVGDGRPSSLPSTPVPSSISSQTFAAPSASQPAPSTSQSTVIVSPVKEPQYLSDMQNADGNANFDPGDMVIDKEDYADSVGICSQVKIISASCNWTGNWWIEYNVPAGYSSFKATIGFSSQSPSDCTVKVQISGDGESLYSHGIYYGDSIPISRQVDRHLRVRLQISPQMGNECETVFGNAEFSS